MLGTGPLGQVYLGDTPQENKNLAFIQGINPTQMSGGTTQALTFPNYSVGAEVVVGVLTQNLNSQPVVGETGYAYQSLGAVTVTKPAGTIAGSLLIVFLEATVAGTFTAPSNTVPWTVVNGTAGTGSTAIAYKQAGGSEPASYTFTNSSGTSNNSAYIVRVQGHDTGTPVASIAQTFTGSTAAPVTPNSTAGAAGAPGLVLGALIENNGTVNVSSVPVGMTQFEIVNTGVAGPASRALAYQYLPKPTTSGDRTWAASGSNTWGAFTVVVNGYAGSAGAPSAPTLVNFTQKYTTTIGTARFTVFERTFIAGDPAASFNLTDNQNGGTIAVLHYAVYNHTAAQTPTTGSRNTGLPTRVGNPLRTNSSGGTTPFTASYPQTPTAGNKLILTVGCRNSSTAATITTPSGWTLADSGNVSVALGEQNRVSVFWRDATGGDAAPSIAFVGSACSAVIEEYTGLLAGAPDTTGNTGLNASSGTLAIPLTPTTSWDWIFTAGCTTNTDATTWIWGGGLAQSYAYLNSAGLVGLGTSSFNISDSIAQQRPTVTYAGSSLVATMVSVAFKRATANTNTITGAPSVLTEALGVTLYASQSLDFGAGASNTSTPNAPGYKVQPVATNNVSVVSTQVPATVLGIAWAKRSSATTTEAFTVSESRPTSDAFFTIPFTTGSTPYALTPADSVTSTDAQVKDIGKVLTDAGVTSDAIAKLVQKTITDTATATDAVSKAVAKFFTDSVTEADAVTKAVGKNPADTVTATDAKASAVGKTIADTTTPTESPSKAVTKFPTDTATATDASTRAPGKGLSDTATPTDAQVKAVGKNPADSVTPTDAKASTVGKNPSDTVSSADAVSKAVTKNRADTATSADATTKAVTKNPDDTATASDAITSMVIGTGRADTVTASDGTTKAVGKNPADTATPADAQSKAVTKNPTDTATASDAITSLVIGTGRSDTVTATDGASKAVGKTETDIASSTDATAKTIGKAETDAVAATDAAAVTLGGQRADTVTVGDDTAKVVGKYLGDSTTPSDLISITTDTRRNPTDLVTVTDHITVTRGKVINLSDSIGCADDFPVTTPTRNICGILYDHESLTPGTVIAGATMRLFRTQDDVMVQQTTTDASGFYQFLRDALDPYTYYVTAQVDGPVQIHGISDRALLPELI